MEEYYSSKYVNLTLKILHYKMFLVYKINSVINTKRTKKISNNNLIEYELKEKLVYQHIFMKLMNIHVCDLDMNTRSLI